MNFDGEEDGPVRAKLTLTIEDPGTGASSTETRPILVLLHEADGTLKGETDHYLCINGSREEALRKAFHSVVDQIEKDLPEA